MKSNKMQVECKCKLQLLVNGLFGGENLQFGGFPQSKQNQNYYYKFQQMFPNVTASKEDSLKDKLKQRKWQDRFATKPTIPDYSPMKDKHTVSYRKLLTNGVSKDKYQSTPVKPKQQKTYFQKKVQLFERLKEIHPVYLSHLQQFEDFLTSSKLPNFYVYYSVVPLMNEIDVNGFILKSRKSIKEQTSFYHRIFAAVKAREECLSQLKDIIVNLKQDTVAQEENKTKVREELANFRTLTANTIDEIKKWRDSLSLKEQRAVFYSQSQQNYLIKMLNDNHFIFFSALSEFINFGQKNDPFLIVPLKKAQGKSTSQFLTILQTQKNLAYYQKYMEYLASQKAYQLSLIPVIAPPKREPKYPEIQKVYKSKSTAKFQTAKKQLQADQNQRETMERQKLRQERLKKNQQRINAIKSVYESYTSKIKLKQHKKQKKEDPKKVQTDVEEKTKREKSSSAVKLAKNSLASDQDFDRMVRNKLQNEKNKKLIFDQNLMNSTKDKLPHTQKQSPMKSATKLPKAQDKMIQNLKEIQQTLKSKLTFMTEESKKQQSNIKKASISGQKFHKKTNQALISELKSEIMKNLQIENQQRQMQRAKRRQQEEKAIDEIKQKMKREMEEKLEQKKREKLLEREELEKKLKEEENRLNKQRELEMQLQLKLAKQKELRQLEKIKRQSLQKEMKYKQELQKQQKLRRQTQDFMQKQRQQKQKALQQLKKKQLKENIQRQIKYEMKSKYGQNVKLFDKDEMNLLRQQKQQELTKEIQLLKLKQNEQIDQIRKENQLRQRMLKLKKQQQELKRKQLQHLMKSVIQQQKQDLQRETLRKRIQLEQDIKNNAKQKLLEEYKAQRQAILENNRLQRERQLQEEVYREKVKDKIQKELRIQAIQRTKRQMEQRQSRKYQISMKLQASKTKFNDAIVHQFSKEKVEEEVKKQLIQKVIFDKQAERQTAKNDLRAQFQKELLASALPSIYQSNEANPILKKNIQNFKDDTYLRNKMTQLDSVKPTNQKAPISRQDMFNGILAESPKKLPRNQSMIRSITNEEKEMYSKKKGKVDDMRSQPSYKLPKKLSQEEDEGFRLMPVEKQQKDSQFDVKIVRKSSVKKQVQQKEYAKKKPKKRDEKDSQDEEKHQKRNKKANQSPSKKKYESEQEDSQDQMRGSPNKKKVLPKKRRQSDQALSSDQEPRVMSKKSSVRDTGIKRNETYGAKRNQITRKNQADNMIRRSNNKNSDKDSAKVYYDAQNPNKVIDMIPQEEKIQLRQVKHTAESKYEIKLQAIPQGDLDEYLGGHFGQLPQIQRLIQLHQREQLYRKLINQLTFCMLLGYQKDIIVGIALAFHDRNKTDTRKFTLIHFSTYKTPDLKDFLTSCVNYIFKKDPADQIQFHYKFDQSLQDQAAYSSDFNKWFDKFGNVFQKKIDQNIYQRKYVMKRQFNQKCDVVLGGINKNTFRNLFSVYCGVVMSDADMIQFKDQLKSVVTPENQISYSIAIAELFRTYLTPDEAETLKGKVKEFAKLKELLILVVMLQKKKVKMDQLKLSEYKNLVQLNMKLMSQGKEVIRYCKDSGMDLNRIYYAQLSQAFNLPFNFQTTSLPIQSQQTGKIHQISYFRLSPLPPNKLHIIKSSLYNAQLHILPTQSTKYKLFVINAQQYNQIKETNHLDVFMYIRLFLKNVKSHNTASWKYVWLPEMTDRANFSVREFKSFLNKDIYCHDSVNISYKQFLPNALIIEPEHRDLVITPPFIVGVMSMALEQVTQGSPLYARMIGVPALRTLEIEE